MPRQSRIVIPGVAHHITQRGNYRQEIFEEYDDYKSYCLWVKEYAQKYGLDILAYCLMTNHVHFVIVPGKEDSLARAFNTIHMRYSQYMNRKRKLRGHLWQGRFFSCFMDNNHLYRAIRYVERNPVRAKMVDKAWDYEWSSAGLHTGNKSDEILLPVSTSQFEMNKSEWKRYLDAEDQKMCNEIRLKTQRGLVIGSEAFIQMVQRKIKRSLQCLNQGRPKKASE